MIESKSAAESIQDGKKLPGEVIDFSSDETEFFPDMKIKAKTRKNSLKKKLKRKKKKKIAIVMQKSTLAKIPPKQSMKETKEEKNAFIDLQDDASYGDEEFNDLSFYSETHEDQDPNYLEFVKGQQKTLLANELMKLKKAEALSKKKLKEHLEKITSKHLQAFHLQVSKFRSKEIAHQEGKRQHLQSEISRYQEEFSFRRKFLNEKLASDLAKAKKESDWKYRANAFFTKQAQEKRDFEIKDVQRKKDTEEKLRSLSQAIEIKCDKRMEDVNKVVQKLSSQLNLQRQHQMKNDLKQHEEIFEEKRAMILKKFRDVTEDDKPMNKKEIAKNMDSKNNMFFQNAFDEGKNHFDASTETYGEGSLIRRNLRQKIWYTSSYQLVVEIHNEGIFLCSPDSENKSNNKNVTYSYPTIKNNDMFIAWGLKSRKFLHSIVTGDVPAGYTSIINKLSSSHSKTSNLPHSSLPGGLIKCMVKDMRTSSESASRLRSQIAKDVKRESKSVDLNLSVKERLDLIEAKKSFESKYRRSYIDVQKHQRSLDTASERFKKACDEMRKFKIKTQDYWVAGKQIMCSANLSAVLQIFRNDGHSYFL